MAITLLALMVSAAWFVRAVPSNNLRGVAAVTGEPEVGEDAVNTSTTITTTGKWDAVDGRVCKKDQVSCLVDSECCSGSCASTNKCRRLASRPTAAPEDAALNAALNACIKLSTDAQAPDQCPAAGPLDAQRMCIYNPSCVTGDAADCVTGTGCQYASEDRLLRSVEPEGENAVNTSTTITTTGKWDAVDGRVCKKDQASCLVDSECCSGSCASTNRCRRLASRPTAAPEDAALNAALNACIKLSTDAQAPDQCPAAGPLDAQRMCIYNPSCVTGDAADCVTGTGCQYV